MDKLEFVEWVIHEMERRGLIKADIARAGHISDSYVSNVLNGKRLPGPDFCRAVAHAFKMSEIDMFWQAGFLDEKPIQLDSELYDIVQAARPLNEERRRDLVYFAKLLQSGSVVGSEPKKKKGE